MNTNQPIPASPLFDVTADSPQPLGVLERVALEQLELAPNRRRDICPDAIALLAGMLSRTGQLVPCIGHRPNPDQQRVVLYAGQRRLLAARATHTLASEPGSPPLRPVTSLIVLLLDHEPGDEEIRTIQAHENAREPLSIADQLHAFEDCWRARAALPGPDRIALVAADLGISAKKAHSLRRQLGLPEPIRARIAERPTGEQISVTLATRLADMHDIAPELTTAVARRITTGELHDRALRDLGAFVHRTIVEDETAYAVRIDDGALLDGPDQIRHARPHLTPPARRQLAGVLGCKPDKLDAELDALAGRAKRAALKLRVTGELRDRARTGRYAYVHERGPDFAAGIWVIDPVFMLDAIRDQLDHGDEPAPPRDESYFRGARLRDPELLDAAAQDRSDRSAARARHADATRSNLGLGHDLRAGLLDPSASQLHALRTIVCHLLTAAHADVIAYGAGWTDTEHQQPVGDTGRREPRHVDAIVDAELRRALEDPDPLRGIAQLTTRWAAAHLLDRAGVTRTKTLGTERMTRRLDTALPASHRELRAAVWTLMRPMLSPALIDRNRDAFATDEALESTVDLDAHRADASLSGIDLRSDTATNAT